MFVAVAYFAGDLVGIYAARPGRRLEALEPIDQNVHEHFVPLAESAAKGLVLHHDYTPPYI